MDTQVEEGCVESSKNYLIDEEEYLLKIKDKILDLLEEEDDHCTFDLDFDEYIKESIEKYQRHITTLRKILMKQEEDIKRIKTDIISQEEEKKKVDDEHRKILEFNVNIKTQIEESKRKEENSNKFMNNSKIIDGILSCQRSPNDKFGLGYNKEVAHFGSSTYKNHEVSHSYSKGGIKELSPTPQIKFKRETPSRWTPKKR
jgi:hypothetical protein